MSGKNKDKKSSKQTQYPPATSARGATVQAVAKALLRPLKRIHVPKSAS